MDDGEDPEFPRRLYTKGLDPIPVKSIHYFSSDEKLFRGLFDALKDDEWAEISASSLGVFLKFWELEFGWASRLVHFMLGFQIECEKKYEIWSLVGVNPVRFSLNEFASITGLNCEHREDMVEDVEVTEEMREYWEKLGVEIDAGPTIEQLTSALDHAESWDREDRLRLGYLAILAGFIEAKKPTAPTPLHLARMVMDLDDFLEYPWGRVAFQNLIRSVKSVDLTKSYTVEGFVEVLQVWAYTAMPDFASQYGEPVTSSRSRPSPPLLAFRGSRGRKYVKEAMLRQTRFNHLIMKDRTDMFPHWDDDVDDVKISNIVRTFLGDFGNWKWRKDHWADAGSKVSNVVAVKDEDNKKRPRQEQDVDLESVAEACKKHFDKCFEQFTFEVHMGFQRCDENFKTILSRVDALETTVSKMKKKSRKGAGGGEHGNEEQVKSNTQQDEGVKLGPNDGQASEDKAGDGTGAVGEKDEETNTEKSEDKDEKSEGKEEEMNDDTDKEDKGKENRKKDKEKAKPKAKEMEKAKGKAEDTGKMNVEDASESVNGEADSSVMLVERTTTRSEDIHNSKKKQEVKKKAVEEALGAKRKKFLSSSLQTPYVGTRKIARKPVHCPGYNPFVPVEMRKTRALMEFLKSNPQYPKRPKHSSLEWYYILRVPRQWLTDTHMDAAMWMFRARYSKHPEWFRSDRICFVDSWMHRSWKGGYNAFLQSSPNRHGSGKLLPGGALHLLSGEYPEYFRSDKAWGVDVDDIYLPIHVIGNHWVAAWISIPHRHITIWDSIVSHATDAEIADAVEPICVVIAHLLFDCAPEEYKGTLEPFTHERVKSGVPQNLVSGDCGVYAIKYMECHALGFPFPDTLCDANMKSIRAKLAAEIFDETKLRGTEVRTYDFLGVYD